MAKVHSGLAISFFFSLYKLPLHLVHPMHTLKGFIILYVMNSLNNLTNVRSKYPPQKKSKIQNLFIKFKIFLLGGTHNDDERCF